MRCFTRGPFMRRFLGCVALLTLISLGFVSAPNAEPTEKRIALVIGNAGYQTGALATSANDAGLIAQTLRAAGLVGEGTPSRVGGVRARGVSRLPSRYRACW